jgi:hypothetical protein
MKCPERQLGRISSLSLSLSTLNSQLSLSLERNANIHDDDLEGLRNGASRVAADR